MVDLSVEICGLKFRNPILPAAGPTVRDGDALVKAADGGAGGLVAKTVSVSPAHVPRPNMVKVKDSILNAELWSDLPLEQWLRFEYAKAKKKGLPLIASVGYKADEIRAVAPKVKAAGVDAIELSTQHLGRDLELVTEATKAAKEVVDIPVFVKLSPDAFDVVQFARAVEGAGADGIVAINALGLGLAIDIENTMPMLGSVSGHGWLSGPAIKSLAVRCVADVCRAVKIPVIGVGGISNERDAVEFIMAGASAVQLSTAAIIRGYKIYGLIADGMAKFMRAKGYNSIADFKGIALRHLPEQPFRTTSKPPEIIASRCTGCGLCEQYCVYEAAKVVRKIARIDPVKCYGCGMCVSVCPTRAVRF
ncbi:Dihydroorotate dehydrogenase B (NAD(+)), catalytic subunit [subsurface metagenome]